MDSYQLVELRDTGQGYFYAQIAAWRTGTRKLRGEGSWRVQFTEQDSLRCDLANDFKIYYASTGTRIKVYQRGEPAVPSWFNTRLSQFVAITTAIRDGIAGPWETESYSRDTSAEVAAAINRYMLRANRKKYAGDKRGTTLNLQVSDNADDTYRNGGAFQNAATTARIGFSGLASQSTSARFTGVSGLVGVVIDSAEMTVTGASSDGGTALTKIRFNKVAAPAAPTNGTEFDALVLTTAGVDWDSPGLSVVVESASPDLAAPLQEIVDAALDPSALQIVWSNDGGTGTNYCEIFQHDTGSQYAQKLDIDHSPAPVSSGGDTLLTLGVQ